MNTSLLDIYYQVRGNNSSGLAYAFGQISFKTNFRQLLDKNKNKESLSNILFFHNLTAQIHNNVQFSTLSAKQSYLVMIFIFIYNMLVGR